MAENVLNLTDEERSFLVELLEQSLKERRVEEHRTRAPNYREFVLKQESMIVSVLAKMGHTAK